SGCWPTHGDAGRGAVLVASSHADGAAAEGGSAGRPWLRGGCLRREYFSKEQGLRIVAGWGLTPLVLFPAGKTFVFFQHVQVHVVAHVAFGGGAQRLIIPRVVAALA